MVYPKNSENSKKEVLVLLIGALLLVVSDVVESVTEKHIINVREGVLINGKNITIAGVTGITVSFDVDGVFGGVKDEETGEVNGAILRVIGISYSPSKVIVEITVNIVCGDNSCGVGESGLICCTDCGCLAGGKTCIGNRCVEATEGGGGRNECLGDADCNDDDPCTVDYCDDDSFPSKCKATPVTACVSGDLCCPAACDTAEDTDCGAVDKCSTDFECDDNDPCTVDVCSGAPKRCGYDRGEGCSIKGECVSYWVVREGMYCSSGKVMVGQRADGGECMNDYECESGICSGGICGVEKSNMLLTVVYVLAGLFVLVIAIYFFIGARTR